MAGPSRPTPSPTRIAILASGSGSNAAVLMDHFRDHPAGRVVLVGCDQPGAGVLQRAWERGVAVQLFSGTELREGAVQRALQDMKVGLVVLAGFLRLIPAALVKAFPGRIVNIHPALLPRFGGRGMYGRRVHEAVLASGAERSGMTIHRVNERYDEGEHLFQAECPVLPGDTPELLAARVQALEHLHYPVVVDRLCLEVQRISR